MLEPFLFYLISFVAIAAAVGVVTARSAVYSLLCLVLTMCMIAGLFVLLKAFLISTILVLVYAGAILVLFLFVVMLVGTGSEEPRSPSSRLALLPVGLVAAALLVQILRVIRDVPAREFSALQGTSREIGLALFGRYVLPFELTSFLILSAVVSVVVLAKKDAS